MANKCIIPDTYSHTDLKQTELLDTVVKQLQGSLCDLPWPLQEDEQRALAREKVAAQV